MYRIFGVMKCMTTFAAIVAFDAFMRAYLFGAISIPDIWPHLAKASGDVALATILLGQTPLFPLICRYVLPGWPFPDIDGQWIGEIESNWNLVGLRSSHQQSAAPDQPIPVKVKIIARLFFIRINLISSDDYSVSKTSFVNISKDPEDKSIQLSYLYKNITLRPKPTDCAEHDGAALLSFRKLDDNTKQLFGTYWTNRAWSKGLNTAGTINLKKS